MEILVLPLLSVRNTICQMTLNHIERVKHAWNCALHHILWSTRENWNYQLLLPCVACENSHKAVRKKIKRGSRRAVKHCLCSESFFFVGARSSISWCLMRNLLIILSAPREPRFVSISSSIFLRNHVDIEWQKWFLHYVLTINCKHCTQYVVSQKFNRLQRALFRLFFLHRDMHLN